MSTLFSYCDSYGTDQLLVSDFIFQPLLLFSIFQSHNSKSFPKYACGHYFSTLIILGRCQEILSGVLVGNDNLTSETPLVSNPVSTLPMSCMVYHVRHRQVGNNGRISFSLNQSELMMAYHVFSSEKKMYSKMIKLSFLQLDQIRKLENSLSTPFAKQARTCYNEAEPVHPPCQKGKQNNVLRQELENLKTKRETESCTGSRTTHTRVLLREGEQSQPLVAQDTPPPHACMHARAPA